MRLSAFILENIEPILQEWEDFARALGAVTESMDAQALRDHAKQILREVAADLETYQSEAQQEAKSKGNAPPAHSQAPGTGAERHGDVRATEGFTLDQMVSEYRALRASVLRLWTKRGGIDGSSQAEQVTRFNEAIDEALAKSVKRYARDVERLIAAAHGKERMAALGTLSAGLGHDMSNVLMPMRVSLDKLEETALTPESRPMLDSLRRSMEHLRGLTRGLRSLSVDPEDTEASPATTELHAWWAEATSPYKWALSPKVKLHASGPELLSLPAVAVPKHVLMQAVFNLVQNAAEALSAQDGGNIWVSATAGEDGATVSLAVRDDGPGMNPETLARCTEPFFTTRPRGRGTGLGLSLVRTAVERHGGRLVIESSPNKGSVFTLVLPVAGRGDQRLEVRQAILTLGDARVRAIVAALLTGVGVEVSVQRHTGGAVVGLEKERETARGFLWVADDSVDPREVLRFLDEGGPRVRAVVLGNWIPVDPGSAGEAATHDGRLIQIPARPSHTTLQRALRRAVKGWAP
jgi:signal transduction histidine kinase